METQDNEDFLVFELDDEGEKKRINNPGKTQQVFISSLLNPKQVLIIVRKDLKRIFLWKGSVSPVKGRFVSSRVGIAIREKLNVLCKIVSVDQGDEPNEFLTAFNLESMPVTETLEDMRFERTLEKKGLPADVMALSSKINPPIKAGEYLIKNENIIKDRTSTTIPSKVKQKIYKKLKNINRIIEDISELLQKN